MTNNHHHNQGQSDGAQNHLQQLRAPSEIQNDAALTAIQQMQREFVWLPELLLAALGHIADGKFVVPDLELDRQLHAVCLLSRVYNRLNAIMFDQVGHGFEHRPACVTVPGEIRAIKVDPLSENESVDYEKLFRPLLADMERLEGETSMVNMRQAAPGVYTREVFIARQSEGSVVLH